MSKIRTTQPATNTTAPPPAPPPPAKSPMLFRPTIPHFMLTLLPGFQTNFLIPQEFADKYFPPTYENGEIDARHAILRDRTQKIWHVKVGYDKREFKDGWLKFCVDHALRIGDFLVFGHHGSLVFDVTIFDPTTCEKSPPFKDGDDDDEPTIRKMDKASSSRNCHNYNTTAHVHTTTTPTTKKYGMEKKGVVRDKIPDVPLFPLSSNGLPYFQYEVKKSSMKNGVIIVPIAFAEMNGLRNRWCNVVLRDAKGESIIRKFRCNKTKEDGGNNHYIYCKTSFYKDNDFTVGNHLAFELLNNGKAPTFMFYKEEIIEDQDSESDDSY